MAAATEADIVRFLRERIAEKQKRLEQIARLIAEHNKLVDEIGALKKLINDEFAHVVAPQVPDKNPGLFDKPLPEKAGLSTAIRHVLGEAPLNGMRPIEVANGLERRKWENTGKVPLPARVAAEMARLKRAGKLVSVEGRYRLAGG
jgi:hypothetical protein